MDVEVAVETAKQTRPPWPYRLAEFLGLLMVLYGLAASAWLIAACGATMIVICYAIHRHRNPAQSGRPDGAAGGTDRSDPDGFDGDGGGD